MDTSISKPSSKQCSSNERKNPKINHDIESYCLKYGSDQARAVAIASANLYPPNAICLNNISLIVAW